MKYCRFVSSIAKSIVASAFFATVGMHAAFAQPHTAVHGDWRITIDESPSQEFVAQALADLQEYFKPPEVNPNLPWCCYVGNYGGTEDPDDIDEEDLPFFRLPDDLFYEASFFRIFSALTPCNGKFCSTVSQFNLVQGGPTELMTHLRETIAPDFDPVASGSIAFWILDDDTLPDLPPIDPSYDPSDSDYVEWRLEGGTYPVYVGSVGRQQLSPEVWSATLSAAPEPSTATLYLISVTTFGLHLFRTRRGDRPHAA